MFRMFKHTPQIFAVDSLAYLKAPADGLFKTRCPLGAEAGQVFSVLT